MNEATIKGTISRKLREKYPSLVVFRHEDRFTHGIPDFAIHGNRVSSFFEIKYTKDGKFKFTGAQQLTLKRLHSQGMRTYLVVFLDMDEGKSIELYAAGDTIETKLSGFAYDTLINRVGVIHGLF